MEAQRLRTVISKMRQMLEEKAEDLMKVVGDNFSDSDASWAMDVNMALVHVEAIAESLKQMSLDTVEFGIAPPGSVVTGSGGVEGVEVNEVEPSDEDSQNFSPMSGWSDESDRLWHLT